MLYNSPGGKMDMDLVQQFAYRYALCDESTFVYAHWFDEHLRPRQGCDRVKANAEMEQYFKDKTISEHVKNFCRAVRVGAITDREIQLTYETEMVV